ncbi:hypothetical protein LAX75_08025 [Listeria cossartiae]|uniref:Uncharacterized protein n=3 Tax=Listeria TaxID=1637 RepID=A0A7X1DAG5_9LIST|nr:MULTISPECIES: hypothetical protein [Listeria]MBC1806815.1 hypothetical protein [Listeria cossartiae subsp. cayugensis]MBC1985860.1 hypothetical protein [Listeria cossartiae subsp. cossartiae]MBC2062939.1 hypothetical protein [Listeria marthii]MBC2121269.1 hypothetical protein [Listeria marthii]MBC2248568.1 hypothetical protein [Listeria cossartiae subsp. cayugensis]
MSLKKKMAILNQAIIKELYKYPEKRLHETYMDLREGSLEFIFAENTEDIDPLVLKIEGVTAYYFQRNHGESRFDLDTDESSLLLLETLEVVMPPFKIGEDRADFIAEGNLILELDEISYVIECKKIKLNDVVFNLDE